MLTQEEGLQTPQTERGSPDAATRVISKIKGKIGSPTNRGETSRN